MKREGKPQAGAGMSITKKEADEAMAKYGSQRKAAEAMKVSRKSLWKALGSSGHTQHTTEKRVGKSLAEFKQTYDKGFIVPQKIKAALKELGAGWEYEVEFGKLSGVSLMDLGRVRDQFADHVVVLNRESKRAWAGTKATAEAMRKML